MGTILICEDDIPLAAYWRQLLEAKNHIVYCSATVSQALQLADKIFPDLIITDMMIRKNEKFLPEGGLTLVNQLRSRVQHSIPVICVSGYRPSSYNLLPALEIAKTMKVDLTLYKPITPKKLLDEVHKLLARLD
ncbi:Response regulator with CheY-like receiver, AAA-type ATPase, and DNA-binding domains [Hyella patelloides LEGE 07179]|uniref:Response regulator with CheY-like receiver, AAA-type ATPase, and DNA-binding domains n=1 Tax=Hyella patelloides LEGE 07179 TaxID=945734 RepID=A0A563VNP0_9CYAN|nr:response regulator [Hyella patelloides]VEP13041.1 Response regulator with CheY-like receiver, AAA-type ATPase, and DNA-binding domains [Hyella patelloides LEGE 07179]